MKKTAVTLAKVLPTMAANAAMKTLAELCDSDFGETVWRGAGHAMRAASARNGFKNDEEGCYVSNCLRTISIRSWLSEGGCSKFDDGSWTFFNEAFNHDATGIPGAANAPTVPLVRTYFDAEKKHRLRADIARNTAKSSMAEAPERALDLVMRSVDTWANRPTFSTNGLPMDMDCMETSLPERQLLLLGGQILHGLGRVSESVSFIMRSLGRHFPNSERVLYRGPRDRDSTPWKSDDVASTAALLAADIYASKGNYVRARNLANDVLHAIPGGTHCSEEVMESNRLRALEFLENLADAGPTDAVAVVEAMPAAPVVEAMPAAPTTSPVHGVASWSSLGFSGVIAVIPRLGWCLFDLPSGGEIIAWDYHVNSMRHRIRGVPTDSVELFELHSGEKNDLPNFILLCSYNERKYGGDAACQPLKLNLLLDLPRGGVSSFEDLTGPDYTRCALASGRPMQEAFKRLEARTTQICWNNEDYHAAIYAIQDLKSDGWVIASAAKYGRGFECQKILIARSSAKSVRGPFSFDARDEPGVLRHTTNISSLVFTTRNVLASGTVSGTIHIWDCRALSCMMHLEADIAEVPWDHHARVPDVPFLEWASNCGGSGALLAVVKEREHECRAQKLKVWPYRDDTSRCQILLLMHPEDEVKSGRVRDILFDAEFNVLIVNLSFCIKTFAVDSSGVLVPQSAIPYRKPNTSGEIAFATHGGFLFFADASGLVAWSVRALGGGGDDADAAPKPWPKKAKGLNCAACGRYDPAKNQICEGCKVVHFCDRACQKAAWKKHKPLCLELRAKKETK